MTDLVLRLRALADRLEHLDINEYVPAAAELTHEMLLQRLDDMEETVNIVFGDPLGMPLAAAVIRAHASGVKVWR